MSDINKKYWTRVSSITRKWYKEFIKSSRFELLTLEQKIESQNIIFVFSEQVYNWEFESPKQWDAHGVLCFPLMIQMEEISDKTFLKSVVPVLKSFFEFLQEQNLIDYDLELINSVDKIETELINREKNVS